MTFRQGPSSRELARNSEPLWAALQREKGVLALRHQISVVYGAIHMEISVVRVRSQGESASYQHLW